MSKSDLLDLGILKSKIPDSKPEIESIIHKYNNPPYTGDFLSIFTISSLKSLARKRGCCQIPNKKSEIIKQIVTISKNSKNQQPVLVLNYAYSREARELGFIVKNPSTFQPGVEKFEKVISYVEMHHEYFHSLFGKNGVLYCKSIINCNTSFKGYIFKYSGLKDMFGVTFKKYSRILIGPKTTVKIKTLKKPVLQKPFQRNMVYKKVNLLVNVKETSNSIYKNTTSITLEEFRKEIESEEFLSRMLESQKNLMVEKIKCYNQRIEDMLVEKTEVDGQVRALKNSGISDFKTIDELFPLLPFYTSFVIELQSIKSKIENRIKTLTTDIVKNNLISILEDEDRGLLSIVGRDDVKDQILSQIYAFSNSWKTVYKSFSNIALMGDSGVGKTAVAKVLAHAYSKSGMLSTDRIKITSRSDLVGKWIGTTAQRTRSVLLQTLEGVLFIDEAYQLSIKSSRDFGHEAITEIVNFIDKYIGLSIIIVAGYKDDMISFFDSNQGLSRRFNYRWYLGVYSTKELSDILFINTFQRDVHLDNEELHYIYTILEKLNKDAFFKNQAGDMLNLSTSIAKLVYSSYRIRWREGDVNNNKPIINAAINDFLSTRGLEVEIEE